VERLYVDFTGAPVRRGQPLLEVYSPMLVAAQEELLLARRLADQTAGTGAEAGLNAAELLESARRRLRYLDVPAAEIARIERSGTPRRTVTLYSPASGVVLEKSVVAGMRIMPGMELYRIADVSRVWVEGEVFEKDLGLVRPGQHAAITFSAYPGEAFEGRVTYLYPTVSVEARTGRVRIEMANAGLRLKPGMYAQVLLHPTDPRTALVVPRSAVHQTGERSMVFVRAADGSLLPREVRVGIASGNDVEILAGLTAGETVVSSASFLIDAESNMGASTAAMQGMDMGPQPAAAPSSPPRAAPPAAGRMPGMEMGPPAGAAPGGH
jgi:Cu(I)/Ag(I) efflux system membrane fusion protein